MKSKNFESKNYLFALIVSCFMSISFCVFEPVKSYITNHEEYWFTLNRAIVLYMICATVSIICCILMYVVISWINTTFANVFITLLFFIALGLYIQGNYIPNTNGVLDGTPIDWTRINVEMLLSDLLWAVLIILFICSLISIKRKNKIIHISIIVSSIALLLELITVISLGFITPEFNEKAEYDITDIGQFELSKNENFIVFVLDAYDAAYLEGIENNDRAKEVFEDFTFYSNAMSLYGHTDASLPQMITGKNYLNQCTYIDYLKNAYVASPILNYFKNNEWNSGIYVEGHIPVSEELSYISNLKELDNTFTSRRRFLEATYRLVAYSRAPYHIKTLFWFYPDFNEFKSMQDDNVGIYSWWNGEFYQGEEKLVASIDNPVFRLYHLRGMHYPLETNDNVEDRVGEVTFNQALEANFKIIERYLDNMKKLNIYDSSNIIVMSDHGQLGEDEIGLWKSNPILFIKRANETHELEESLEAISYEDLQSIYMNLLSGKESLDGINTTDSRMFYRYVYDHDVSGSEYLPDMTEYVSDGVASDIDAMVRTGKIYSCK